MQVVIDIPDKTYECIKDGYGSNFQRETAIKCIKLGTLRKGKWINRGINKTYMCSLCHKGSFDKGDYCSWCGADMRGDV